MAASSESIVWSDPQRHSAFSQWLAAVSPRHRLAPGTLKLASADASFRRYFRVGQLDDGASFIIMDAPPDKEDCAPFVKVARLMRDAGLHVPEVLAWDEARGFMLLDDLGNHTMMQLIDRTNPGANLPLYLQAVDALIQWQLASKPGVLPPYNEVLMRRELGLFPEWYLGRHRGIAIDDAMQRTLDDAFTAIVGQCLAWPSVYVHRDFMPRNLMVGDMAPTLVASRTALPPKGVAFSLGAAQRENLAPRLAVSPTAPAPSLGVLDFQDAVYGPITYDVASLMRDAFLTWEEDFVLDVTVRYWEQARKAGLPVGDDFGAFYRGVEWMGIQRHLKVAGIFARLTLRDGKPQYLADAPRFIEYIRATAGRYRELKPLLRLIDRVEGTTPVSGFAYGRM